MASGIERTRNTLADSVAFDLVLGGIDTGSSKVPGKNALDRFRPPWDRVSATTGQHFGYRLPDGDSCCDGLGF